MIRMKQARLMGQAFVCALVLAVGGAAWAESIFADANLEAAVRQQVHDKRHTDEPLTADDVKNVATVNAADRGITDLAGLEHCRALAALDLSGNAVADLSPIADLPRLQTLNLADNDITDVSPLAGLAALQYLDLSDNAVEDVSPLRELTRMRSLYLSNNQVTDPGELAAMERLWSLYLDGNPIEKWELLEKLPNLSTLDVSRTGLSDASVVRPATRRLRLLMLDGNALSDVSPLVRAIEEDANGERRFAPFLRVYLRENPLSDEARDQLDAAAENGARITID